MFLGPGHQTALYALVDLIRRLRRDERGVIALKFAMAIPVLLLVVAGAIDLQHVHASRARLQDVADAAALAGARELGLAASDSGAEGRAQAYVDGHLKEWPQAPEVESIIGVEDLDGQRTLKVVLAGHRDSFFGNLLPPGGWKFQVVANAMTLQSTPLCVLVTGNHSSKMLNVKDQGELIAPACMVHSNRDIDVENSGLISAAMVQAVTSARGMITPQAGTGAVPLDDPFSTLDLPEDQACTSGQSRKLDATSGPPIYLKPGVYCEDIIIGGEVKIFLDPGEYWFLGGKLIIKENARLEGNDVVLFFDKDSKFEFTDNSLVKLTGRKTGVYAGMVMVGTRGNTQDFLISSDHVETLLGVIYVPEAKLIVEGKAEVARQSAWTVIVANYLELKGSPALFINADYAASDVPVPSGVGPSGGGAQLVR